MKSYNITMLDSLTLENVKLILLAFGRINAREWWLEPTNIRLAQSARVDPAGNPNQITLEWDMRWRMPWIVRRRLWLWGWRI